MRSSAGGAGDGCSLSAASGAADSVSCLEPLRPRPGSEHETARLIPDAGGG
jgi:hypothetical protein